MIDRLKVRPPNMEDAIQVMNDAAGEIDRLLTVINNAQSVLTYEGEGISSEERIRAALSALSFGDR